MKGITVVAAVVAALLIFGGTAVAEQDSKGKALFEEKCSACHDLGRALRQTRDRDGWTATVKRMQQVNRCPITDAQAQEIIDHLVKIRGKGTPAS